MPFVAADLEQIDRAIVSGERVIRFTDGREVVYRDVDELRVARKMVQDEIAASIGSPGRHQVRFNTRKGW